MASLSKDVKRRILDTLSFLTFISWVGFLYLHFIYYQSVAPTKYDPATGHIYEINCHGYYFYLDAKQNLLTYFPLVIGGAIFLAALLLERRWKIYKEINELRLKPLKPY